MGRRLDNSDRGALVSIESARRIAEVVRKVEGGDRNIPPLPLRTAYDDGDPVRIGKVSEDWAVGTCATVTIWEGLASLGVCEPTQSSPAVEIENVRNLSHDVQAQSWVAIAKAADGSWYLVEAGSPDDSGSCRQTIGGEDLTTIPGWDGSAVQLLGHDASGCLKWFDTEACDSGSGS